MAAPTPASAPTPDIDVTQSVSHQDLPRPPKQDESASFPHIEGYDIKGVLGRGGMGVVYRAVQRNLGRVVALKVLPVIAGSTSPNAVARFRREATAAARLHHTNIIPVYDFGEAGHALYYAMELIEGEPLSDLIPREADSHAASPPTLMAGLWRRSVQSSGSGSTVVAEDDGEGSGGASEASMRSVGKPRGLRRYYEQVSRWMTDAADALDYAHKEDVIHRDIKPANLILSHDHRIMIADFGLAKTTDDNTVTRAGSFLGTLRYASPEQAKGYEVDHRSDIYSLGATMYELLCFQPAYPMLGQKEMLHAILEQDPEPPRRLVSAVPPELETICLKAMEKSAGSRYQTAREMADDLRRYASDMPIVARRPSLIQRTRKFVRRNRLLVTAVTAVFLVVTSTLFTMRAQAERRRAEVERHYESGMYWAGEQKWAASDEDFQAALSIDPDHIQTMLAIVWMNIERHKREPGSASPTELERLDQLCQRVLALDPDQVTALSYRSILLKNLERYDEAIAVTRRVIELHPNHYAAWSNLGAFLAITGDLDGAVQHLRHSVKLAEQLAGGRAADQASVWRNLGAAELYLKQPEAFDSIHRALRAQPHDVASWLLRIRARLMLEGYENSVEALDDAKHADRLMLGANARTKRLVAMAYLSNQHYQTAASHARTAMELGDEPAFNLLIAAVAEAHLGHVDEAKGHLEEALASWPVDLLSQPFVATYDEGVLWFESAEELNELRDAAERALHHRLTGVDKQ